MNKDEAFTRITQTRQELLHAIEHLSEAEITGPAVEGEWTVKDVLGHLAAWEKACLEPLECLAAGGVFRSEEIPDHDTWNAIQAAQRRAQPPVAILEELHQIRSRLLAAAYQLSASQWSQTLALPWGEQASVAQMLNGLAWHEEEHLKTILHRKPA